MSEPMIRCLVCGGRGGWWSGFASQGNERRDTCGHCHGTGWEPDPSPALVAICAPSQDYDGFTPGEFVVTTHPRCWCNRPVTPASRCGCCCVAHDCAPGGGR